ncbi:MAG: hypothetical protein EP330_25380 [Deltaproteobacteria bacterium]|nr:MAG: hypothetical protein EP330_25380 [Deltaproteobacteria bacterium]
MRPFALALLLVGCADNQALCERATERINEEREACGLDPLGLNASCFAYENLDDLDCGAYFACEADRIECVDGQLVQDLESCPSCE